jgi:hypothetical protein
LRVSVSRAFSERWEAILAGGFSDGKKAYIGDGTHADGSLAARFYFNKALFLTGGATIGADWNSQYRKKAIRGFAGGGVKFSDFVVTVTAFSPPSDLQIDANQVKGINTTVEYFKTIAGPFGVYSGVQGSVARFNQTGGDLAERFTGVTWKARAGVFVSF